MNQVIVIMDTGFAASRRAAEAFAARGASVHVLAREDFSLQSAQVHPVNLLDAAQLRQVLAPLGQIDILVLGAPPMAEDGPIGTGHDADAMLEELVYTSRGTGNVIEAALPQMEGGMKRIACITVRESSVATVTESDNMLRHMALACVNKIGRELFNSLRPKGFTFRWYAADDAPAPMSAVEYILCGLSYHPDEYTCHNDEDRIVIRDGYLKEVSW